MSGFTINGQTLDTLVQSGTLQGGGKFTGASTGNSTTLTPSKVNPGLNFGFTVDGEDVTVTSCNLTHYLCAIYVFNFYT